MPGSPYPGDLANTGISGWWFVLLGWLLLSGLTALFFARLFGLNEREDR